MPWEDAVAFAVGVASVSVTRAGAIPSLPTRAEL
jgi:sugar/nucleoside kinase (ribokinase family)